PIGGGIAYEGFVSPSGVGYDIGCGNKAARTELTRDDLDALGGIAAVMGEITRRISFGMGVPATERSDHPVLERIRNEDSAPGRCTRCTTTTTSPGGRSTSAASTGWCARVARRPDRARRASSAARWATSR